MFFTNDNNLQLFDAMEALSYLLDICIKVLQKT